MVYTKDINKRGNWNIMNKESTPPTAACVFLFFFLLHYFTVYLLFFRNIKIDNFLRRIEMGLYQKKVHLKIVQCSLDEQKQLQASYERTPSSPLDLLCKSQNRIF